ncbi:MAG: 2-succinyl-6-hydroxy-2,4-cyclohexadiene-1-carboxylate synthase [Ignavibacteria bacterium RBG_13_36_8]|nr:MAG: 2-succinyl-6-hydroxy-2,4-cyclohexadiene-1-carboxylate synthase [Ignavibacteria bacterium RBG_13_36_8]
MKVQVNDLTFHIEINKSKIKSGNIPVIFLHGFTGSSQDWKFIIDRLPMNYLPCAIDLIGHGKSSHPDNTDHYTTEAITNQLNVIITQLGFNNVILSGYSMGGRAALSFTVKFPSLVKALILESTTPGISNEDERKAREQNDLLLVKRIESEGVKNFIDYWMNLPLFNSLKTISNDRYKQIIESKQKGNAVGLMNILRCFSTGLMPAYWNELNKITHPVLLITGELDEKFTTINKEAAEIFPNCHHSVIKNTGHNVHLEKPEEFIILVNQFLNG